MGNASGEHARSHKQGLNSTFYVIKSGEPWNIGRFGGLTGAVPRHIEALSELIGANQPEAYSHAETAEMVRKGLVGLIGDLRGQTPFWEGRIGPLLHNGHSPTLVT